MVRNGIILQKYALYVAALLKLWLCTFSFSTPMMMSSGSWRCVGYIELFKLECAVHI